MVDAGRALCRVVTVRQMRAAKPDRAGFYLVRLQVIDVATEAQRRSMGRAFVDVFSLNPNSAWKIKAFCSCVGRDNMEATKGTYISLTIEHDNYGGGRRPRTKSFKKTESWKGLNISNDM